MYAGALTLTQPLYMGGKIRAYNKITKYAEELARQQHDSGLQDVILSTDQAYWQVVSLASKKKLAEGYLKLLQKLESDVDKMIAEGVATKADGLSVKVRVNEAEMTLTKVEDGLSLSRMLLCQLCGLDLSSPIMLKDEREDDLSPDPVAANGIDLNTVYGSTQSGTCHGNLQAEGKRHSFRISAVTGSDGKLYDDQPLRFQRFRKEIQRYVECGRGITGSYLALG